MRKPPPKTLYENKGISIERLPSGKLDAYETFGFAASFPERPELLVCDCCLNKTDRLWLWNHRGFCIGFPNAGRGRTELLAGSWAFCVYCRPLFVNREIQALAARAATLNPELDPHGILTLHHVLPDVVYGECSTWEAGQKRPRVG